MGRQSKKRAAAGRSSAQASPRGADRPPPPAPATGSAFENFVRYPSLVLAWITLGITVFSIGVSIRFHDNMEMGAIREPTGSIIWAAISLTLFASAWRQRRRDDDESSRVS